MSGTSWLLLICVITNVVSIFMWQARMLAAEKNIQELKSNSNKFRAALLLVTEVLKTYESQEHQSTKE